MVYLLDDTEFIVHLMFILLHILAISSNQYILYTIPLFTIIVHYKTLLNVVKSITYHSYLLMLISIHTVLLIYIFTIYAYTYLDHTFYKFKVDSGESICSNLM